MSSLVWWQRRAQPPHTQANRVSLFSARKLWFWLQHALAVDCYQTFMAKWQLFIEHVCIFKGRLQSLQPEEEKCRFCLWETDGFPLPPITKCTCLSAFAVLLWEAETLPATKNTSHCYHSGSWSLPIMNIIIPWPKIEIFVSELIRQRIGRPK